MARLSIELFGPFQVTLDGEPVIGLRTDKVRALLAYLAVESDRPHRREKLIGLLWPGYPESSARRNLTQARQWATKLYAGAGVPHGLFQRRLCQADSRTGY